jgi:hypothetical protein
MNDDNKPNGGDDGDNNVIVKVTGKRRHFTCYINMGYQKKDIFFLFYLRFVVVCCYLC